MKSIVVESKQKLVLPRAGNETLLDIVPHSKPLFMDGQEYIAMEHGVEEMQILRNLGIRDVPAPILNYYDWPARFSPMEHQRQTSAFLVANRRALCLNAPGTGKSLSALWAADYLLNTNVINKVLIVSPLSTLKPVWGKELMHHMPHRNFEIVVGPRQKREQLLEKVGVDFFIINHDGFTTMPDAFKDFDLIIYDEATALKTPTSQRFKRFAGFMGTYSPWLWMLTGTPIAQSPVDAWALARLVKNKEAERLSYTGFKDRVMKKVTQFKWIPRPEALDRCKEVLQPSIRYDLDECKDLPDMVYINRECNLTKVQAEAFKELQEEACLKDDDVLAPNAAVLFQKLLQVCCGVAYDSEGKHVEFDDSTRIEMLEEIIAEVGDKCIVFVPLRGVQQRLYKLLTDKKMDVAIVNGDVSKKDRDDIFYKFQNTEQIQILLAHPKVAAHGLTLTRANSIIWYAPIYSLESYEQANARIRRLDTEGKTVIYHLGATPFEFELYKRLETKQQVLTDFLDMVRGVND